MVLIGEQPITSLDELTAESVPSQVANTLYDHIYEAALGVHPWRFATTQVKLPVETTTPTDTDQYKYEYQMPAAALQLLRVYPNLLRYEKYGDKIWTNHGTGLTIDYVFKQTEDSLPAYFVKYLVYQLAKDFVIAVTENSSKWDIYANLADRELVVAKHIDSRQRPGRGILDDAGLISRRG
jgi:hypothetical protein